VVIGYSPAIGLLVSAVAMFGDLTSSFIKRRLALAEGSRSFGLDHVPEALFPALILAQYSNLDTKDVVAITAAFVLLANMVSPMLYTIGIRKQPY
jgi:hypothetical protein